MATSAMPATLPTNATAQADFRPVPPVLWQFPKPCTGGVTSCQFQWSVLGTDSGCKTTCRNFIPFVQWIASGVDAKGTMH